MQEAADTLKYLSIQFELDRQYDANEIGHFRAFARFYLKEIRHDTFSILFGSFDKSYRLSDPSERPLVPDQPGIKHGVGGGQWEQHIKANTLDEGQVKEEEEEKGDDEQAFKMVGGFHAIGMNTVNFIVIRYSKDTFIRFGPGLCLKDFDEASYIFIVNKLFAKKINNIRIFANGYKLDEFTREEFVIDETIFEPSIPTNFTDDELADPWVRIRPTKHSSAFDIRFSERTPMRLFGHRPAGNSIPASWSDIEGEEG